LPPLSLLIKPVSGACNMRCGYCFYMDEMDNRTQASYGLMSADTAKAVIRRGLTYAEGHLSFSFQGGEPTLAGAGFFREWIRQVNLGNIRRLPVSYSLQTNGLNLNDDMIEVLTGGQFLVGVSLDGTRTIHDSRRRDMEGRGTYERILENIAKLKVRGIPYNILCVVDHQVAAQGIEVFEALKPHGYLQFIPCLEPLEEKGETVLTGKGYGQFLMNVFKEYERSLLSGRYVSINTFDNWIGILQGRTPSSCGMRGYCSPNYMVESNGNVYPCDFYGLDEWLLGNLTEDSLFRVAKNERMERFLTTSRSVAEPCLKCAWLPLCRGGCRRDRQTGIDTHPGLNRLCAGYQMFFDACFDRLKALARLEVRELPQQ
jgi:uncharacterized protein